METLTELIGRYPKLAGCQKEIEKSAEALIRAFEGGKRLYLCGNGGSAADADHIVGELMKGFLKKRPLPAAQLAAFGTDAEHIGARLSVGLPAISLHSQSALLTAFMNDEDPALVFAQALYALGEKGDVLLAISTSGSSANIVAAAKTAKALGMCVIALTGQKECALDAVSDFAIHVGDTETYRVQELHLPVYHWLCAAVEEHFFPL